MQSWRMRAFAWETNAELPVLMSFSANTESAASAPTKTASPRYRSLTNVSLTTYRCESGFRSPSSPKASMFGFRVFLPCSITVPMT
jgi:hypothetical protein